MSCFANTPTRSILWTIDVEQDWAEDGTYNAVGVILPRFLKWLRAHQIRATFFVVADLLKTFPNLVADLSPDCEVALHGLTHERVAAIGEHRLEIDLKRALEIFKAKGVEICGYRAPFLEVTPYLFPTLEKLGLRYDSSCGSLYPHLRNIHLKKYWPWKGKNQPFWELPLSSFRFPILPFTFSYARFLSPCLTGLLPREGPIIFLLHLHEFLDMGKMTGIPRALRYFYRLRGGEEAWSVLENIYFFYQHYRAITCREFMEQFFERPQGSGEGMGAPIFF